VRENVTNEKTGLQEKMQW